MTVDRSRGLLRIIGPTGRDRMTAHIKCRLLFTVARKHGWSREIPGDALVRMALRDSEQGDGHDIVMELADEQGVIRTATGLSIRNDPDSQALLAVRLVKTCGYSPLQVEATLSRFAAGGGFDTYDRVMLAESLDSWRAGQYTSSRRTPHPRLSTQHGSHRTEYRNLPQSTEPRYPSHPFIY